MDSQGYAPVFFPLMVIALGLILGGGAGLIIGYGIGVQKPAWSDMTRREKGISILLVAICSITAIAVIGYYGGLF